VNKQKGVVLITSLVLLLIMTMLGVTAMSTTIIQEKMAGNSLDRERAFQAAEAALRDAEQFIENPTFAFDPLASAVNDSCTNGLCTKRENNAGFDFNLGSSDAGWIDERWLDPTLDVWNDVSKHRQYTITINGVSTIPKYIIEYLTSIDCPGSINGANDCEIYRITAQATGGTINSRVMLQSTYRIRP